MKQFIEIEDTSSRIYWINISHIIKIEVNSGVSSGNSIVHCTHGIIQTYLPAHVIVDLIHEPHKPTV